jgi:hypothetical protein
VAAYDLAKLQLLNKKCYNYFVPKAMAELNLKLEMAPCLLSSFEPDVVAMIEEKKAEGVKMRTSQFLTLRFDKEFKQARQRDVFMADFLQKHP